MKILAPITRPTDVRTLRASGADEFYGGITLGWEKKYHMINSINRRYYASANFQRLNDLIAAVRTAEDSDASLYITLNTSYYIPKQYPFLKKYIKALARIGITGFILSDINLIRHVRKNYPNLKIHVSTVTACINIESIRFFEEFDVDRIVLPRELTVTEIIDIRNSTDVALEVFYSPLSCSGIDGYCGFQHIGNTPCLGDQAEPFYERGKEHQTLKPVHMRNCRLCQIYDLYKNGIDSIKVIGRGDALLSTQRDVVLLKKMLDFLAAGDRSFGLTKEKFHELVIKKILPNSSFECDEESCLYKM